MQDSTTKQGYMPQAQTVEWSTPQDFYDELNREFQFTIDVAADANNTKCPRYYDEASDGLRHDWTGETVWCNPPYGRGIADWVRKAALSNATTVMLIPSRTDVRWFHDYVYGKAEIRFVKGRLKFGGQKASAPFPNMVVVFRPGASV
jgi:phage N-6-adenine-methyltransferase